MILLGAMAPRPLGAGICKCDRGQLDVLDATIGQDSRGHAIIIRRQRP